MDDTLYLFVNKHIYTVDSYWCIVGFRNSPLRRNGVDTMMTFDAAKWNGNGGGHIIMCYKHYFIGSCIIIFGTNLPDDF